jgi:two-component system, chemotaxis family, chemotaxis protein CheY
MTSLSELHVLIVDDNKQMRVLTRALMRAVGILRVSEAETAAQAFEVMSAAQVDLIVADWKMQPIDGIAFTRMARREGPNPYVPILMMTAHTEMSRVAAARDAGVNGFIKKPISAKVLLERISSVLTDARMYVRTDAFFGPDRRRGDHAGYAGPFRRASDMASPHSGDELDLDDKRWRA